MADVEPRSTFKPGVSQHHHLLATRAAQRLTAETWVLVANQGAGRVCAVSSSQAARSSPPSSPGRWQGQMNRESADAHCFSGALRRARDVCAPSLLMYTGHVSQASKRAIREPSVCVDCENWYPSTYIIFIAHIEIITRDDLFIHIHGSHDLSRST